MSPQNNTGSSSKPPPGKLEKSDTASRKPQTARQPHAPPLNCPRCESPNTKFCYYNNYNLSQPRHFCKTCRRYWTRGGALRNVPIGGGSRRNNRKTSSSTDAATGGLKLFQGISPAMDFHWPNPISQSTFNPFSSIGDFKTPDFSNPNPVSGSTFLNSSSAAAMKQGDNGKSLGFHGMGIGCMNLNLRSHLTPSSIESLSSLNQDLHLKLQQQRLAMVLEGSRDDDHHHHHEQTTIHFHNLDNSRNESCPIYGNTNWGGTRTWSELDHHFTRI